MANSIQAEIETLVKKLYQVAYHGKRESQKAFAEGAKPIVAAIKARAPVSGAPHSRYKGSTEIVYHPGNLRRSFRTLKFRRSAAVFVGPKVDKAGGKIEYKGAAVDGWYGHFVEFGTVNMSPRPFVRPAVQAVGGTALNIATRALKREIDKYATRIGR